MIGSEDWLVTETIRGAQRKNEKYPLLPGDVLHLENDGTYHKDGPGLSIGGFVLTEEQAATLKPVLVKWYGLQFTVEDR